MKEFSRFELAAIKRTAANVKSYKKKMAKLMLKKQELDNEINALQASIDLYEDPVKKLSGGFTTDQILSGEYKLIATMQEQNDTEQNDTEQIVPILEPIAVSSDDASPLL